jgi:regulator of sigma E protease
MTVIIFIIILALLVFVHELGHFLAAKASKIRVDEFAIGFPPKIVSKQYGETKYSLNAVPFGGYVKIFGENPDEESVSGPHSDRSFVNKPKLTQVMVLVAGVTFNILFAWILLSAGLMAGTLTSASANEGRMLQNERLMIVAVSPGSPAAHAGLRAGDTIITVRSNDEVIGNDSVEGVQAFIANQGAREIEITYSRAGEEGVVSVIPEEGIVPGRVAIGIGMDVVGTLKLPFLNALWEGARHTVLLTRDIAVGLGTFLYSAITGGASLQNITGPVGIAGMVGEARTLGLTYLLSFTAIISINLALINLIPFPALDGGRILFVFIEAIKGSPIKPTVANAMNAIGFLLLILLMLVVTYNDIARLFT